MPNFPDALLREDEAQVAAGSPVLPTNSAYQASTSATILDLRRLYGQHFAPGYGDTETLGKLLANSGLNTLDQYLERHMPNNSPPKKS